MSRPSARACSMRSSRRSSSWCAEEPVVHLPERPLVAGGLRRLRGELGVGVYVVQRQVAPHVADAPVAREQLAHDGLGLTAVGALEVAVLDDRHRRLLRPADVVALGIDRVLQVDDRVGGAEQQPGAARGRERRRDPEDQPRDHRSRRRRRQDAELGLVELLPGERQRRDEQADREADPRDAAGAEHGDPAHRRAQPAVARTGSRATTPRRRRAACRRRTRSPRPT